MKGKKFNNSVVILTSATKTRWEGYSKKNIDIANDSYKERLQLHCYKLKINSKVRIMIVTIESRLKL